jgi:hypothetical protein
MSVQDKAISGAAAFLLMTLLYAKPSGQTKLPSLPRRRLHHSIRYMLLTKTILPGMG